MKYKLLAVTAAVLAITGCSSPKYQSNSNPGGQVAPGNQTAISEQRGTEDFKREGIKIEYSWGGMGSKITALEVTGYAPVWGNSANAMESSYKVAELDAKRKLNDFINRESITSSTSVTIISRNLEKAQDNKRNTIASNVTTSDAEVESAGDRGNSNTAVRQDALNIASTLQQNIRTSSRGILGALRMVDNGVMPGGRQVRVVFRWEESINNRVIDVRKVMAR
jgi:hypothetical protein